VVTRQQASIWMHKCICFIICGYFGSILSIISIKGGGWVSMTVVLVGVYKEAMLFNCVLVELICQLFILCK
jgi:hypothetical protein